MNSAARTPHSSRPSVRHPSRRSHRLVAAALAASTALLLSSCQAAGLTQQSFSFADVATGEKDQEWNRIPAVVGADATDIRMLIETRRFGAQLSWESEEGITAEYCEAGPLDGTSEMVSDWWPDDLPADGWTCGWWAAFELDGTYYAWDTREGTDEK